MITEQDYSQFISERRFEEAKRVLDRMIAESPADDKLYFERGKLLWRTGNRSAATSDFSKAVDLNPQSPAATALEQATEVADFFNPDLYNP